MGMDVFHYKIESILGKNEVSPIYNGEYFDCENQNILTIVLDQRMKNWLSKTDLDQECIRTFKEFDWKKWLDKFPQYNPKSSHYDGWVFEDYRLVGDKNDWMHLTKETESQTETEILKAGFTYIEKEVIFLNVKEVGYMRKPFRHSQTPIRSEGDSIIITVDNFSEYGWGAQEYMRKISTEQTDNANLFVFEKLHLNELINYTNDKKMFSQMFIENFHEENSLILFNW